MYDRGTFAILSGWRDRREVLTFGFSKIGTGRTCNLDIQWFYTAAGRQKYPAFIARRPMHSIDTEFMEG